MTAVFFAHMAQLLARRFKRMASQAGVVAKLLIGPWGVCFAAIRGASFVEYIAQMISNQGGVLLLNVETSESHV